MCSLPRRLAAITYDAIVVAALFFPATALVLALTTGGEAIAAGNLGFTLYLTCWAMAYFAWSWAVPGQTLGMRAWRIRIRRRDGARARPGQTLVRFVVALLGWLPAGLGYWWALLRRDRRTWHDLASGTDLVMLPGARQAKGRRR